MSGASLELRRASSSDVDAVATLFDSYRVFYKEASDLAGARSYIAERLHNGDSVLFLAESDGRPAGFVHLYPMFSSTRMRRLWVLNDLYVDPAFRRTGAGRALMRAAETYARETDACGLILETAVGNTTAQALYESEGYVRDTAFFRYERFFA